MILFDIANLHKELKELEGQTTNTEFWNNAKESAKVLKKITLLKNKTNTYQKVETELKNTLEIVSIQKDETIKELSYIESIIYELENVQTVSDIDDIYTEISV